MPETTKTKMKKKAAVDGMPKTPRAPKAPQAPMMTPPRRRAPANPHAAPIMGYGPAAMHAPEMAGLEDGGGEDNLGMVDNQATAQLTEFAANAMERGVVMFQLREGIGGAGRAVDSWGVEDDMHAMDAEGVGNTIWTRAEEDAEQTKQPAVKYTVWACKTLDAQQPFMSTVFTVHPQNPEAGYNFEDGATPGGQMAQAHRHNEIIFRVSMGFIADMFRNQRLDLKDLRQQNQAHFSQQLKVIELVEKLQDRTLERDVIRRKTEKKEERIDKAFYWASMYIPDVARKFGITPTSTKDISVLYEMLANMPQQQLSMFMQMLPNDKARDAVQSLWVEAKKNQASEAEFKAKRLAAGKGTHPLTGVPDPKQIEAAPSTASATTAAVQAEAPTPKPRVDVSAESTLFLIVGALANLDDNMFSMIIGAPFKEIGCGTEEGAAAITAAREVAKSVLKAGDDMVSQEQTAIVLAAKKHIFNYMGNMEPSQFQMLLGMVDKTIHEELTWLYDRIRTTKEIRESTK